MTKKELQKLSDEELMELTRAYENKADKGFESNSLRLVKQAQKYKDASLSIRQFINDRHKKQSEESLVFWKKRLETAVDTLNGMDHNIVFSVEETGYSIGFSAHSKQDGKYSFGSYMHNEFFEDYLESHRAYQMSALFAEMLIAGTKLCDNKAFHNFKLKQAANFQ